MGITLSQFNRLPDIERFNSRQQHRLEKLTGAYEVGAPFTPWNSYVLKLRAVFNPLTERVLAEDIYRTVIAQRSKIGSLLELKAPARLLNPHLGEALMQTKAVAPPIDRIALPAFHLFLPQGLLDVDGIKPRVMACIDRRLLRESLPEWWLTCNFLVEEKPGMAFVLVGEDEEGKLRNAGSSVDYGAPIDSITTDQATATLLYPGLLDKGRHLLSTLLTYMACEIPTPEAEVEVAQGSLVAPMAAGGKRRVRGLRPVMIGADYRPKAETVHGAGDGSGGKRLQPHWRTGHFHPVCYGPQKSLRRLQWYEPVRVNAEWKQA